MTATLIAMLFADALAATVEGGHPAPPPAPPAPPPPPAIHAVPRFAALPMTGIAGWTMRRCGGGTAGAAPAEGLAAAVVDLACSRLTVRDRVAVPVAAAGRGAVAGPARRAGFSIGGSGVGWRLARAVLPGLQGIAGPGGAGLGLGSELALVRGARMTLHLAAPRDTRIARTLFAPETTVLARCQACWTESDAIGAGVGAARRTLAEVVAPR